MNKPILAIVLWFVFGFVFAWSDRQAVDDKTALFRKKLALLESTKPGGRVIIAGGSNAFWGVSSAALEESLGRPVINIAIPSEIEDPLLMQKLVLKIAQPGDVVVISFSMIRQNETAHLTRVLREVLEIRDEHGTLPT